MKTEWLRKTIADFDPYFVAPIAEKHVINANENIKAKIIILFIFALTKNKVKIIAIGKW